MKKLLTILCCVLFAFSTPFLFTGCGNTDTMTVFYNEVYETDNKVEIPIKIKNNSNARINILAKDFSIKTKNGYRAVAYIRDANFLLSNVNLENREYNLYLVFDFELSNISDSQIIYYLGQSIEIMKQVNVNIKI